MTRYTKVFYNRETWVTLNTGIKEISTEDNEDGKGMIAPFVWWFWWCMGRGHSEYHISDLEESKRYTRKLSLKQIPRRKPKDDVL